MDQHSASAAATSQLRIEGVHLRFGGITALTDVSMAVEPGTIHAIIGPNGAGKTSLLNCISGLYAPQRGRILFAGRDLVRLAPHQVARHGIARSFQNIELFRHMTVLDNLMLGRHIHMQSGVLGGACTGAWRRRKRSRTARFVEQVIDLLEIQNLRKQTVGSLAYGLQKRVELGARWRWIHSCCCSTSRWPG